MGDRIPDSPANSHSSTENRLLAGSALVPPRLCLPGYRRELPDVNGLPAMVMLKVRLAQYLRPVSSACPIKCSCGIVCHEQESKILTWMGAEQLMKSKQDLYCWLRPREPRVA